MFWRWEVEVEWDERIVLVVNRVTIPEPVYILDMVWRLMNCLLMRKGSLLARVSA
jgi:hypothetical protein